MEINVVTLHKVVETMPQQMEWIVETMHKRIDTDARQIDSH